MTDSDLEQKFRLFKEITHDGLDQLGVPPFNDEECRIKHRMKWLVSTSQQEKYMNNKSVYAKVAGDNMLEDSKSTAQPTMTDTCRVLINVTQKLEDFHRRLQSHKSDLEFLLRACSDSGEDADRELKQPASLAGATEALNHRIDMLNETLRQLDLMVGGAERAQACHETGPQCAG